VTIPPKVQQMGQLAFGYCTSLKSVIIPSKVTYIGFAAFVGCANLTSVVFQGTYNPGTEKDGDYFKDTAVEVVCVPSSYLYSAFCLQTNLCKSDSCETFVAQINECYEAQCEETVTEIKKRENVTAWENMSDGCTVYTCSNESGMILMQACIGNDEVNMTCMNDICQWDGNKAGNRSVVIITVVDCNDVGITSDEILTTIGIFSGVDEELMHIGVERNDLGHIVRIIISVDDEQTAVTIVNSVEQCIPSRGKRQLTECSGILRYIESARIKVDELVPSGDASDANLQSASFMALLIMAIVLVVVG